MGDELTDPFATNAARRLLLEIYAAALRAVAGRPAVRNRLASYAAESVYAVALGKAAVAMAQGAADALQQRLVAGLLITKHGYAIPGALDARWSVREAEHPLPGADSLAAGTALIDFLARVPPGASLLFLISGGTSALVEVLPPGVTATQLHDANDWLLGSGWDIGRVNRVRRALSAIKDGRLASYLAGHPVLNLLLSDVPGDDLAAIGSGLLIPPVTQQLAAEDMAELPAWLRPLVIAALPRPADALFATIHSEILRGNADARAAAVAAAQQRGLQVFAHDALLHGDAVTTGAELAREALHGAPGLHVWGGETTVRLPAQPGRGGRCQSLALAAAQQLADSNVVLLAAGTDGSDGPGEEAGALVDGGSLARGELDGFDATDCLRRADAGSFLEASGDLVQTGPTGSNVMDLILAWRPE